MGLSLFVGTSDESAVHGPERGGSASAGVRRFGDYELLAEIARGGMGIVYRARQVSLDRLVAVKLLLFGQFSSAAFVKRFKAEAAAAAGLQHPNIVAIHEIGEHNGQHYFSMDLIAGRGLDEVVRSGPLPPSEAAACIQAIAEAIHYAHERGVVHRDLKPSNVLIDPSGQPRITDFGLARRLTHDSELTATGQIMGSPSYMSPEQARGKPQAVHPATDVYSVGAILYFLLTGRPPFYAESVEATLDQLTNNDPIAPRLLHPLVPRDLETICLKCLEKTPARRYGSARALAEDLKRFLRGEPIVARPARAPERLWRWCQRKPALAASIALLAIVAVGSTTAAVHLRRMREEARANLYVADMNVALRDSEEGNTAQALELLKRHIPAKGQKDLRQFEWRYLWRKSRGNYSLWLPKHEQVAGSLEFSPDGKLLAAYYWDRTLRVWHLGTSSNLFVARDVSGFAGFSADGCTVAISRTNALFQACDLKTGLTNSTLENAGDLVALGAHGETAVTITPDSVLKVWKLPGFQLRMAVPGMARRKSDFGFGDLVAISPDGRTLALVEPSRNLLQPDSVIRLWDVESGKEQPQLPANAQIRTLEFTRDGSLLALGDGAGRVTLWNLATRRKNVINAHNFPVLSLAFSRQGNILATGSSDENSLRLWDVATGSAIPATFGGQVGDVWSIAFSPDGKYLASGTRDGPIRIWEVGDRGAGELIPERLHADNYGNFVFSADSRWMAAGCADSTVKVWEAANLKMTYVLSNASYVVAFSRDSKRLLVASKDGNPWWHDFEMKTNRSVPQYGGDIHRVLCVDFSPDRRVAALGLPNGAIQLLNVDSGELVRAPLRGHIGPVRSVAFSPTGDKLASGGSDKAVMVWDVATGQCLEMCSEHKGGVFGVAISPNGRLLASGCGAETIKLWNLNDLSTGSLSSISYHKSVIRTLAFSPNGCTLASGSEDNTVKLWNVNLRRQVASFRHESHLRLVLFSPDGNNLATITDNGVLRVFRTMTLAEADDDLRNPLK